MHWVGQVLQLVSLNPAALAVLSRASFQALRRTLNALVKHIIVKLQSLILQSVVHYPKEACSSEGIEL